MSRIKLEKCLKPIYSTELTITISHINYGNHVGNDSFLGLAHEARMRFIKSLEQSELSFFGTALIMSDAAIMFRSEVKWGETLRVVLALQDIQEYGFDILYSITSQEDQREVARIKTGMTFFNYQDKKLHKADEKLIQNLIRISKSYVDADDS